MVRGGKQAEYNGDSWIPNHNLFIAHTFYDPISGRLGSHSVNCQSAFLWGGLLSSLGLLYSKRTNESTIQLQIRQRSDNGGCKVLTRLFHVLEKRNPGHQLVTHLVYLYPDRHFTPELASVHFNLLAFYNSQLSGKNLMAILPEKYACLFIGKQLISCYVVSL